MTLLTDIVPAQARKYVYAAFALAGLLVGALSIAGVSTGHATDVLTYLGVALGLTAASNVPGEPEPVDVPADPAPALPESLPQPPAAEQSA